jgi:hypothetical protein
VFFSVAIVSTARLTTGEIGHWIVVYDDNSPCLRSEATATPTSASMNLLSDNTSHFLKVRRSNSESLVADAFQSAGQRFVTDVLRVRRNKKGLNTDEGPSDQSE